MTLVTPKMLLEMRQGEVAARPHVPDPLEERKAVDESRHRQLRKRARKPAAPEGPEAEEGDEAADPAEGEEG